MSVPPEGTDAPVSDEAAAIAEMQDIVAQEEKVLARVARTAAQPRGVRRGPKIDYDAELIALRDQIAEARLEDIPPLVEEMERLSQIAVRRAKVTEGVVDPNSPYFGRLVLEEDERRREVLIGRSTFLDPKTGIRIVDWRDAPVSRIYYRYEEGDDYDEIFGGREVEGDVVVRRTLGITQGKLRRIGSPQGSFRRAREGTWSIADDGTMKLSGGQGAALRPEDHRPPGQLGVGDDEEREDKHLADITALIDPRQFDVITQPATGLAVIQGGAGSGKTTIGLHRLAYLAFQEPKRFRSDKMLVIVFNDALVRYIGRVLPALGVAGVPVVTYERWAAKLRRRHLPALPEFATEETPSVVVRFKKHPALLHLIDEYAAIRVAKVEAEIRRSAPTLEGGGRVLRAWEGSKGAPLYRLRLLRAFLSDKKRAGGPLSLGTRHAMERVIATLSRDLRDVSGAWAEMLTDPGRIREMFARLAPGEFTERELEWCHSWCARRCDGVLAYRDERMEASQEEAGQPRGPKGVDGADENEIVELDIEDDALLLRLYQRLAGRLRSKRDVLNYEHIFVDETQDLSPVELAVILDTVSKGQSITLAGDVAQKLHMDNGFSDWSSVLGHLGLDHVEIEPLELSYRSTHQIFEFATDVLGPLRNEVSGRAIRSGAPVELFRFGSSGEAVGFLGEALRDLTRAEPLASVAVIARYPEQADLYFKGLQHGEVPNLRRVADQDFLFRPGVDVTDVRQVKGLEFDYVILVEASAATYPPDHESRHLMHIAATRAAHQLWATTTGSPSTLIPEALRDGL